MIAFVGEDCEHFKSSHGLPEPLASLREIPLSYSICQYAVASGEPLVVSDARRHPLLRTNLAVTEFGVVAYAGAPLITSEGHCLGTISAIDWSPRHWTDEQVAMLQDLAATVITELELRRELTDRTRVEAALRESEARFRAIVEQSELGISLADATGHFRLVNQRFCELLGRTEEELLGLTMHEVTHPEDLPASLAAFGRLVRDGQPFGLEKRYRRPDGTHVWSNTTVSAVHDAAGRLQYIVAITQDITERRRSEAALAGAQKALQRSEEHFRSLIEHTSDIITIVDESGVVLYGSPSVERVLRISARRAGRPECRGTDSP